MKIFLILLLSFVTGCASSQKNEQNITPWSVQSFEGYSLVVRQQNSNLKVDTIRGGDKDVYIFERIVGRIEVDAGYMERIWMESKDTPRSIEIPSEGLQVFYERLCRCEYVGFHPVAKGHLQFSIRNDQARVTGTIYLEDAIIEF